FSLEDDQIQRLWEGQDLSAFAPLRKIPLTARRTTGRFPNCLDQRTERMGTLRIRRIDVLGRKLVARELAVWGLAAREFVVIRFGRRRTILSSYFRRMLARSDSNGH